jgi:beta-phosphoglucomutase-like phosphatase (HAD superfamily)
MKALLFDLDGTLIDSMPHHRDAWAAWYARRQLVADTVHLFARRSLALVGGAREYLERARAAGFRLALCTASTVPNMALAFERHGIDRWVETIVSPADIQSGPDAGAPVRGKPHPDIFLEAARRLGVEPAHCVVFEDAPLGIEGARRAGMRAVALTTTLPAAEFTAFDNLIAIAADFSAPALIALIRSQQQEQEANQDA